MRRSLGAIQCRSRIDLIVKEVAVHIAQRAKIQEELVAVARLQVDTFRTNRSRFRRG